MYRQVSTVLINWLVIGCLLLLIGCANKNETEFREIYGTGLLDARHIVLVPSDGGKKLIMLTSESISANLFIQKTRAEKNKLISQLVNNQLTGQEEILKGSYMDESYTDWVYQHPTPDTIFWGSEDDFLNYSFFMQKRGYVLVFNDYQGSFSFLSRQSVLEEIRGLKKNLIKDHSNSSTH